MGYPKLIVFVRHAESDGNIRNSAERAQFDVPTWQYEITPTGKLQTKYSGEYLRATYKRFDAYFRSYYQRVTSTSEILFPCVPWIEDARLAEGNRGIWHIMTTDQVQAQFPFEIVRKEREGLYHYRPWGGENWPDIELRILSFLDMLRRDFSGQRVIICGHGHWAILFDKVLEGFSIEEALARYRQSKIANASVTVYRRTGWRHPRLEKVQDNFIPWQGKL